MSPEFVERSVEQPHNFVYSPENVHELSGLPNRRALQEALENATSDKELQGNFGLIFADLDGVKELNDAEGHSEGDKYIRYAAGALRDSIRPEDMGVATHISGDEFAVLVGDINDEEALGRIRRRLQKNLDDFGIPNAMGGKIHEAGETPGQMLAAADKLMYEDKIERKLRNSSPEQIEAHLLIGALAVQYGINLRDTPMILQARGTES